MCVSFCSRFAWLYWNHEDCSSDFCPVVAEVHGSCQSCRHKRVDHTCALTYGPLPTAGGCCHWNIETREGLIQITPAMVSPLAGYFDRVRNVLTGAPFESDGDAWLIPLAYTRQLDASGVPYQITDKALRVDPEQLMLVTDEPVADILERLDTPYQLFADTVWVDPSDLSLPAIFGRGSESAGV